MQSIVVADEAANHIVNEPLYSGKKSRYRSFEFVPRRCLLIDLWLIDVNFWSCFGLAQIKIEWRVRSTRRDDNWKRRRIRQRSLPPPITWRAGHSDHFAIPASCLSSQVSSSWTSVLFSSHVIWRNVIEFDRNYLQSFPACHSHLDGFFFIWPLSNPVNIRHKSIITRTIEIETNHDILLRFRISKSLEFSPF